MNTLLVYFYNFFFCLSSISPSSFSLNFFLSFLFQSLVLLSTSPLCLFLSISNLYIHSSVYLHHPRANSNHSNLTALPTTSHSCSPDTVQVYFRGKSASCTCRLTAGGSGNPRGTADWYQGDTVQTVGSGGSLTLTYQPNSE